MSSKIAIATLVLLFAVGLSVSAQINYTPLAPIPEITGTGNTVNVSTFIQGLVKFSIGIAGALAVLMIIWGGIQYISTDAWGKKSDAKGVIQNAIIGFILAIGAYSILYTINPKLVDINIGIKNLPRGSAINASGEGFTEKTADDLGCEFCQGIDPGEFSVSPNACSNKPCYASAAIVGGGGEPGILGKIKSALAAKGQMGSSDYVPFLAWQIVKAYPPRNAASTDPACFKKEGSSTGRCIHIALPNPSVSNIKRLLDSVKELPNWKEKKYIVPTAARANVVRSNLGGVNSGYFDMIKVNASSSSEYLYLEH